MAENEEMKISGLSRKGIYSRLISLKYSVFVFLQKKSRAIHRIENKHVLM